MKLSEDFIPNFLFTPNSKPFDGRTIGHLRTLTVRLFGYKARQGLVGRRVDFVGKFFRGKHCRKKLLEEEKN